MIDVLLATYKPNPAWLQAQIASIRRNAANLKFDFRSDLKSNFAQGNVVNLIRREDAEGRGACQNFAALLDESRAEYVAFSDQDDVWLDDKLSRALAKMRELESRYGKKTPLLVFADARVVDANLNPIADSLFAHTKIDPSRTLPRQLALQNVANGNTMLFNAALRDLARPIPAGAFMHDHWVMLVASAFGHIACLREPALLYRQHSQNVLGGAKVGFCYFLCRALQGRAVLRERLYGNIRQVEAFVKRFGDSSPACFKTLGGLRDKPYLVRASSLLRHRVFKNGLVRNLGTLAIV